MKTNYICPVYFKWMQRYPSEAREQRKKVEAQLLKALQHNPSEHFSLCGEAYEMSMAIVLAPREPTQRFTVFQQDLLAFYRLALLFASHPQQKVKQSQRIVLHLQHQLVAMLAMVSNDAIASAFITQLIRNCCQYESQHQTEQRLFEPSQVELNRQALSLGTAVLH